MSTKEPVTRKVIKFLGKLIQKDKAGWDYSDAPDPRQSSKVKHSMGAIIYAIELGLLSNQSTLRDVEQLTHMAEGLSKTLIPSPISDTTLDTEARRLDSEYLHNKLITRVRNFHRNKMLEPCHLPCGVLTVDGKNLATLNHGANGLAQPRSTENTKWQPKDRVKCEPYFLMPALRATLTSAEARPCVYQHLLPVGTGEATQFKCFLEGLQKAYGRSKMFEIIDGDAGLTSLENANLIIAANYLYVLGLKTNQRTPGETRGSFLPMLHRCLCLWLQWNRQRHKQTGSDATENVFGGSCGERALWKGLKTLPVNGHTCAKHGWYAKKQR